MKGFWNDDDGLTTVDILALTLGLGSLFLYWRYGAMDTNFADIVVAVTLAAAGQKVGTGLVRARGGNKNEPTI